MGSYAARDVQLQDVVQDGPHTGPVAEAPVWVTEARLVLVYVCRGCGCRHTLERFAGGLVTVVDRRPAAVAA